MLNDQTFRTGQTLAAQDSALAGEGVTGSLNRDQNVLIQGFSTRLDAAIAASQAAGATSTQLQPFNDLRTAIKDSDDYLAATIATNYASDIPQSPRFPSATPAIPAVLPNQPNPYAGVPNQPGQPYPGVPNSLPGQRTDGEAFPDVVPGFPRR